MNLPKDRQLPYPILISLAGIRITIKIKTIVICLLILLAFLFILSLHQRVLHIDEAILAEQAYWLMEEGTVKSVLYKGIGTGLADELLVYHKLYIWLATGLSYPFGLYLPLLRSISLLSAILLCLALYKYSRRCLLLEQSRLNLFFLLLLLLLFSNFMFFAFSFIFRPEIMQTLLGFMSFYMLSVYLKKDQLKYLSLAALLAGLSALTHLNGLIYMGAGGLLLLYKRKVVALAIFSAVSTLVTAFYFIDVLEPGAFDRFITQFAGAPAFRKSDLHPLSRVIRVLDEHKRYFHSSAEISFSIFFILLTGARFKYLWKHHSSLMLYTLFAALSLAIINQGQTSKYALLLLPFACLIMALSFMDILRKKQNLIPFFGATFLIYLGIQLFDVKELMEKKMDLPARNARISQHIPEGSRVLAPASFFFDEYRNYEIISFESYYALVERFNRLEYNRKDFFHHPQSLDCEYIILDLLFLTHEAQVGLHPEEFDQSDTFFGYKVIQKENSFIVLKEIQDQ